jgi:uncharacterized protein (TIGR02598 family)
MKTFIKQSPGGFSLAEITLVIGIAAITIIPLVSFLPLGLNTLRESASRSAEARILQTIASDYQMRTWVPAGVGVDERPIILEDSTYHFDEAGLPVIKDSFNHRYSARAIVRPGHGPSLNVDGSGGPNRYLRQLNIRITADINKANAFEDGSGSYWERSLFVANLEQTGTLSAITP